MTRSFNHGKLAIVFCLMVACGREPTPPVPLPVSNPDGLILLGTVAYPAELYVMRPDGSGQRRLTRDSANDLGGHWSPDGRQIVFSRAEYSRATEPEQPRDIHVMNADGSGKRRVYHGPGGAYWPKWSPDGSRIAFYQADPGVGARIWVMQADGSSPQLVTELAPSIMPDWSPDGSKLVYIGRRAAREQYSAYVIRIGDSAEELLGGDDVCLRDIFEPQWSPDGSRIVYRCSNSRGGAIHVMNADGTSPRRLSAEMPGSGFFQELYPVWSPDGTRIAFASSRGAPSGAWVMDSSGANARPLGGEAGFGLVPVHWGAVDP